MKFTPGQVKEILSISQDTFRHWKNTFAPMAGRNGYTPCFSSGDLLTMAVIKTLTEEVGIRVGELRGIGGTLFEHCSQPWAGLERTVLLIDPLKARVTPSPEGQAITMDGLTIAVPLRSIVAGLREHLLLEQPEASQEPLRFPPTAIGGRGRRGEAQ
ncbi:MAG: hypothetical protein QOC72_1269 [Methylobacteriaceae bacterium]|jgi:hypothetical protein|nr:hypothetical protein [Methylobacteriaceae bacterium]